MGSPIAVLLELGSEIARLDPADCPAVIGALEQIRAQVWARMMVGAGEAKPDSKLTIQQVAKRLNVLDSCAHELTRQKKIKSVRVGKYIRVTEGALKEYSKWLPTGNEHFVSLLDGFSNQSEKVGTKLT